MDPRENVKINNKLNVIMNANNEWDIIISGKVRLR